MSRFTIALFVFLVSLTALAQPGLCPCWLMIDAQKYHPHPGNDPEREHKHAYLADLFNADSVAVEPLTAVPISMLIALAMALALWRPLRHNLEFATGRTPALDPPPPRWLSFHLP